MFLHLGGNAIVQTRNIIAILNMENGRIDRERILKDAGAAKNLNGDVKAIVVTDEKVFGSPISSLTLKKRAEYFAGKHD